MSAFYSRSFETPSASTSNINLVGLGIELPTPILAATTRCAPLAGLGIYIDPAALEEWEGMTPSPSPEQAYPSPVPMHISVLASGEASVGLGIDVPALKATVLSSSCRVCTSTLSIL